MFAILETFFGLGMILGPFIGGRVGGVGGLMRPSLAVREFVPATPLSRFNRDPLETPPPISCLFCLISLVGAEKARATKRERSSQALINIVPRWPHNHSPC